MTMKSLYVTSVESFSGKTATCLALGKIFIRDGYQVGYLKPLSVQPWRTEGKVVDEDSAFVIDVLGLEAKPWDLSPVVVTSNLLREYLQDKDHPDLMEKVQSAYQAASEGKDIILIEGGGSLREGYALNLPTPRVAAAFNSFVVTITTYHSDVRALDDAIAAQTRLGENMCGLIINRVPKHSIDFVNDVIVKLIEKRKIKVLGVLPEEQALQSVTVAEILNAVDATLLTNFFDPEKTVETLTVGAMTADAALKRFRKQKQKAVITGGDRADIQLAALETSTSCLILTGNLQPSPLIIKQAEAFRVPVLLVRTNTMETVEAVEPLFGRTRMGQSAKLEKFEGLLIKHLDLNYLYEFMGLESKS
jgi:BioD-like phosphotransacetylase family protein